VTRLGRWIRAAVRDEFDAARRELDLLCAGAADRRPIPVAAAIGVSAAVVVAGNGIVVAGRVFGHDQAITLVTVPAVGAIGAVQLRRRGRQWADVGIAPLSWPDRPLPKVVFAAALVLAVGRAAVSVAGADEDVLLPLARVVVGTALGEELVHRGVLLAVWSATRANRWIVVVANMVTFGLWHVAGAFKDDGFAVLDVLGPALLTVLLLWARLPVQAVFIAWAWWCSQPEPQVIAPH
jgi:hypothetical protein